MNMIQTVLVSPHPTCGACPEPLCVVVCRERERKQACTAAGSKVERKPTSAEDNKESLKERSGRTWGQTTPAGGTMAEREHLDFRVSQIRFSTFSGLQP